MVQDFNILLHAKALELARVASLLHVNFTCSPGRLCLMARCHGAAAAAQPVGRVARGGAAGVGGVAVTDAAAVGSAAATGAAERRGVESDVAAIGSGAAEKERRVKEEIDPSLKIRKVMKRSAKPMRTAKYLSQELWPCLR